MHSRNLDGPIIVPVPIGNQAPALKTVTILRRSECEESRRHLAPSQKPSPDLTSLARLKEEQYQRARERIFGSSLDASTNAPRAPNSVKNKKATQDRNAPIDSKHALLNGRPPDSSSGCRKVSRSTKPTLHKTIADRGEDTQLSQTLPPSSQAPFHIEASPDFIAFVNIPGIPRFLVPPPPPLCKLDQILAVLPNLAPPPPFDLVAQRNPPPFILVDKFQTRSFEPRFTCPSSAHTEPIEFALDRLSLMRHDLAPFRVRPECRDGHTTKRRGRGRLWSPNC